ncbi:MAG: pinensin family lanthipeptide [Acidobacteriota bacterium]|nr:pinensin family lanthipeptide [Acidobacteriota bacterium]
MKKKLTLTELKVKSFTTKDDVEGGNDYGTLLCSRAACTQLTYCLIIGTNNMYQCIEDGCGY